MEFTATTPEHNRQVFKLDQRILMKLNIINSGTNIVFWNKYQILLYNQFKLSLDPLYVVPDFIIFKVISDNNYLFCLDCAGNIHITNLKLKYNIKNNLKIAFNPRIQNIISFIKLDHDHLLCLRNEVSNISLCICKTVNIQVIKEMQIDGFINKLQQLDQEKCILKIYKMNNTNVDILKIFQNKERICNESYLVIFSLDSRNIYGCLVDTTNTDYNITAVHLYYCPIEVCEIDIVKNNSSDVIIIALKSGTVIELMLGNDLSPKIKHLNAAIYKCLFIKNAMFYTDGCFTWKINDIFSDTNLEFKKIFVKQVNDLIMVDNKIICVTFSNHVYIFPFEMEALYLVQKPMIDDGVPASKALEHSESLLNDYMLHIRKNEEIIKKINVEDNFTAALALCNRPDIMNDVIEYDAIVYEDYQQVLSIHPNITLVNKLSDYFQQNCNIILIKLQLAKQYKTKLKEIFVDLVGKLKFLITFKHNNKIITSVSIDLKDNWDKESFIVPIHSDITELQLNIRLICLLPGPLDCNQRVWSVIYGKQVAVTAEHFIKTNPLPTNNIINLRQPKDNLESSILNMVKNYHGLLFSFNKVDRGTEKSEMSFYIKLPELYERILSTLNSYSMLNSQKAEYLMKKLGTKQFLKVNQTEHLHVDKHNVKLAISKDMDDMFLTISADDAMVAYHIWNFFAQILHDGNNPGACILPQALYTFTEGLKRDLNENLYSGSLDKELICNIGDSLNKNVIGRILL